jgi:hypothetical protein
MAGEKLAKEYQLTTPLGRLEGGSINIRKVL